MRLGIDASNIRDGGGVTHLHELLRAGEPRAHGISKIIVWAGKQTLQRLTPQPWLTLAHEPLLDQSLAHRVYWQKTRLPQLVAHTSDCLFAPGGSCGDGFRPVVAASQNLLPFDLEEAARYGFTPTTAKFALLHWQQARSFRHADGVIFLTEYARSLIMQSVKPRAQTCIIPHGINEQFRALPRAQKPLGDYTCARPFRLLYVSRVEPYKHQWQVVAAVAQLRKEGLPICLDLIGPPTHAASVARMQRAIRCADPDETFIHYHAEIPYAQLPQIYRGVDAFVFASSCESMSNALLEAMAAGLPCASTWCGSMIEVLGNAGVYFNPEKTETIAAALRKLVTDHKLREQCAWQAYGNAQAYTWEKCAHATYAYLADVTQAANRHTPEPRDQVALVNP